MNLDRYILWDLASRIRAWWKYEVRKQRRPSPEEVFKSCRELVDDWPAGKEVHGWLDMIGECEKAFGVGSESGKKEEV